MTRSEDLLYSLTTVIIRYHDKQSGVKILVAESDESVVRKKSRSLAKRIINDNKTDFKTRLEYLIKECTESHADRRPFLSYLLNEIISLKSITDQKTSFSPIQYEEYKKQIAQLLIDFKQLLSNSKGTTPMITQHKTATSSGGRTSLEGLIDDSYLNRGQLCNSGLFLKEEILDRYNLTIDSSELEINEFAQQLCQEHQNALLIPELTAKNDSHSGSTDSYQHELELQLEELKEAQKKLNSILSKQQLVLCLLYHQYTRSKYNETRLQKTIERHEETIEDLTQKVNELSSLAETDSNGSITPGFGFFRLNL
ncbi:hypothetical protein [Legionella bononiensis]|uniref:Uncharacterized protein n=1 Tax=Legionella bononiensis TaxID=2793102 RepID=A0ABS1W8K1_9GAMM|nr:hypothetical protein [Legionella bononiensis]MBL7479835.1 hypothetical protein [Legionella bononiensis]MBL7525650.1 hypothetical protein [Legionella bononiensis]MBL7561833.1 hypothetical protein [Legionella bononiensis]